MHFLLCLYIQESPQNMKAKFNLKIIKKSALYCPGGHDMTKNRPNMVKVCALATCKCSHRQSLSWASFETACFVRILPIIKIASVDGPAPFICFFFFFALVLACF